MDTGGSCSGVHVMPLLLSLVPFCLLLLYVIVPLSSPFWLLFSQIRGSLLGDPCLAFLSGLKILLRLSRFLVREIVLLRQFLVSFLFSSFPVLGVCSFLAAAPHTSRKGRTHLLVGIPPGGRTRPSAE